MISPGNNLTAILRSGSAPSFFVFFAPLGENKNQHVGRKGMIQAASLSVRSVASISFWRFW